MQTVQLRDKSFRKVISSEEIMRGVQRVAGEMDKDLSGLHPLFVCVLNGAFRFASDLMGCLTMDCEITFVRLASYNGTSSGGYVKTITGLQEDIRGRHVVILEDIVDTGLTAKSLFEQLEKKRPASVRMATLLFKPSVFREDIRLDYISREVPDDFLVGYGLDYLELGRNLNDLYVLCEGNRGRACGAKTAHPKNRIQ